MTTIMRHYHQLQQQMLWIFCLQISPSVSVPFLLLNLLFLSLSLLWFFFFFLIREAISQQIGTSLLPISIFLNLPALTLRSFWKSPQPSASCAVKNLVGTYCKTRTWLLVARFLCAANTVTELLQEPWDFFVSIPAFHLGLSLFISQLIYINVWCLNKNKRRLSCLMSRHNHYDILNQTSDGN